MQNRLNMIHFLLCVNKIKDMGNEQMFDLMAVMISIIVYLMPRGEANLLVLNRAEADVFSN